MRMLMSIGKGSSVIWSPSGGDKWTFRQSDQEGSFEEVSSSSLLAAKNIKISVKSNWQVQRPFGKSKQWMGSRPRKEVRSLQCGRYRWSTQVCWRGREQQKGRFPAPLGGGKSVDSPKCNEKKPLEFSHREWPSLFSLFRNYPGAVGRAGWRWDKPGD